MMSRLLLLLIKQACGEAQQALKTIKMDICNSFDQESNTDSLNLFNVLKAETFPIVLSSNVSAGKIYLNGTEALVKGIDIPSPVMGSVNMVPLVHIVESLDGLALAPAQSQTLSSILLPVDITKDQHTPLLNESVTVISEEHIASASLQHDLDFGLVMPVHSDTMPTVLDVCDISGEGALVIENIAIEPLTQSCYSTIAATEMHPSELVAYLQTASTIPLLEVSPLPPLMPSSETVLSPAIIGPITSTVPIVSKYTEELYQFNSVSEQGESDLQENEMCNETVTTAELVSIVVDLQKKVKAFQQRHRRHCSKLEVMEEVVEQLKKENVLSEEKLNFLQVACLQSNIALPESGDSFAIVCQEDDQTIMYSLPLQPEEETQTVFQIEEQ
ncbi:uncharacterized protein LOC100497555 isoform X2 [Xenopus tropicalis]|uniref:Uncharacterized protein LOC100497555 isoform X2 n=1 Tax=Xenopus tropicalis TaxID=8364 RepID=A0A8J1INI7_XENTR|nr:uncharacterized protein LOC100497555 isoform X2 [Xenopus tropicalis]